MAIYSEFSHWKWWFSIAMLNYQRVSWKDHEPSIWPCDILWPGAMLGAVLFQSMQDWSFRSAFIDARRRGDGWDKRLLMLSQDMPGLIKHRWPGNPLYMSPVPGPPHPPPPPPMVSPPTPNPPHPPKTKYLHVICTYTYTYTHIYSPFHASNLASLRYLQHLRATTSSTDLVYLYISIITFFSNRL